MACGYPPDLFWDSSPREVSAYFKAARIRADREHEAHAWLAWHTAALPMTKKFPKFEDFTGRKLPAVRKSPQEVEALIRRWAS